MYNVERYLGHLKSMVRNKARPETCIANAYVYKQALGFVTEHFELYPGVARVIWDLEEDERDLGEFFWRALRKSKSGLQNIYSCCMTMSSNI